MEENCNFSSSLSAVLISSPFLVGLVVIVSFCCSLANSSVIECSLEVFFFGSDSDKALFTELWLSSFE